MFLGHYAVGLAAKKAAPGTSLGVLILSSTFLDLLWPFFLLLGLEHVRIEPGNTVVVPLDFHDYPISHSLVTAIGWSLALGFLYFAFSRYKRGSWIVGFCVLSHWILDALVHRPDLPIVPGWNVYMGAGLWNSLIGSIVVELGIFLIGLVLYLRTALPQDRIGKYGLWAFVVLLVIIWVSSIFGPPPPNEGAIAVVGNASWLFVLWAYWIDRHRKVEGG